jgi:hypothetical protein
MKSAGWGVELLRPGVLVFTPAVCILMFQNLAGLFSVVDTPCYLFLDVNLVLPTSFCERPQYFLRASVHCVLLRDTRAAEKLTFPVP